MSGTFNDFYLDWRAKSRRYTRRSLVGAALSLLEDSGRHSDKQGLASLPWLSVLALKWICQDKMLSETNRKAITSSGYNELINSIWNHTDQFRLDQPLELQIRKLLRPQVGFQRQATKGYVREAALIDRLEPNHTLRALFVRKTGLEPKVVLDLFFCLHGPVQSGTSIVNLNWFEPLFPLHSPDTVRQFFSLVSRSLPELQAYCQALPDAKEKRLSDAFEFPTLVRYPFIRAGDSIRCIHPMLYFRAMEGLVHKVLGEEGQTYMDRFGNIFESHVLEQAKSGGAKWYSEEELRGWLGNNSQVPDLLLNYPDCNIFVESKAGLFDESVMTIGSREIFASKLRAVRKAMKQGWSAALGVRTSHTAPQPIRAAGSTYLLIITNKDLGTSNGDAISKMAEPGEFDPDDAAALTVLPHGNIYVLPIDDFERLMSAVRQRLVDLPVFLKQCATEDAHSSTMKLVFTGHFDKIKGRLSYSTVVDTAYEAATERVMSQLAPTGPPP